MYYPRGPHSSAENEEPSFRSMSQTTLSVLLFIVLFLFLCQLLILSFQMDELKTTIKNMSLACDGALPNSTQPTDLTLNYSTCKSAGSYEAVWSQDTPLPDNLACAFLWIREAIILYPSSLYHFQGGGGGSSDSKAHTVSFSADEMRVAIAPSGEPCTNGTQMILDEVELATNTILTELNGLRDDVDSLTTAEVLHFTLIRNLINDNIVDEATILNAIQQAYINTVSYLQTADATTYAIMQAIAPSNTSRLEDSIYQIEELIGNIDARSQTDQITLETALQNMYNLLATAETHEEILFTNFIEHLSGLNQTLFDISTDVNALSSSTPLCYATASGDTCSDPLNCTVACPP